MGKRSRPTSGQQTPAAPVPIKTSPAPTPASNPADESAIEAQVESLLDQAERQVQTITNLVSEDSAELPSEPTDHHDAEDAADSLPDQAASAAEQPHPTAAASAGESEPTEPVTEGPVDTAALQNQVDAILAQAGHPAGPTLVAQKDGEAFGAEVEAAAEPSMDAQPESDPSSNTGDGDAATARDESASAADLSTGQSTEDPQPTPVAPEIDLAAVDAVIADAAQRAMEEDEFESGLAGSTQDAQTIDPPVTPPASREACEPESEHVPTAPAAAPPPAPKRKLVVKGGDASMRREKPKKRPPARDRDLDGEFPTAPIEERDSTESDDDQPLLSSQEDQDDLTLRSRVTRFTFRQMAAMNAPWHSWTKQTRYAVLGITFLNVLLATVAYYILLRRWF